LKIRKEKGAILIEAILGITIATLITVGLVTALVSSLSNSTFSRSQTIATGYAQEDMELLRSYKDADYAYVEGRANGGSYYFGTSGGNSVLISGSTDKSDPSGVTFNRSIRMSQGNANCPNTIYAEVSSAWNDSKCSGTTKCHKVTLRSCFSNLEYVPLP
jgi:hypothetical protein